MKTIKIQEDCGIKKIGEFYDEIMLAMENEDSFVLDFSGVRRVDLSVAQVVKALRRYCEYKGGICEIRNASEETARLLSYAGIH
ncbi:MAG: STAS domain-containing protein [Spirochaetes bacterium]|nr:STAS domain-containing protein [Spirochaetota bacterium]